MAGQGQILTHFLQTCGPQGLDVSFADIKDTGLHQRIVIGPSAGGGRTAVNHNKALSDFRSIQQKIEELEAYYTGKKWMKDYEDYEAGKIPKDLPCGVLSEDAVYDLLTQNRDLILEMLELAKERIR